ncbi:MAG: hypothetical protein R3C10_27720 [Pirellulales bacterium]
MAKRTTTANTQKESGANTSKKAKSRRTTKSRKPLPRVSAIEQPTANEPSDEELRSVIDEIVVESDMPRCFLRRQQTTQSSDIDWSDGGEVYLKDCVSYAFQMVLLGEMANQNPREIGDEQVQLFGTRAMVLDELLVRVLSSDPDLVTIQNWRSKLRVKGAPLVRCGNLYGELTPLDAAIRASLIVRNTVANVMGDCGGFNATDYWIKDEIGFALAHLELFHIAIRDHVCPRDLYELLVLVDEAIGTLYPGGRGSVYLQLSPHDKQVLTAMFNAGATDPKTAIFKATIETATFKVKDSLDKLKRLGLVVTVGKKRHLSDKGNEIARDEMERSICDGDASQRKAKPLFSLSLSS